MNDNSVARIERAMVAIRRSQRRRALSRLADRRGARRRATLPNAMVELLDAVEEAGGAATVTELAAALDVDQPRASRLVSRALAGGLVRRGVDAADGRRSPLALTAAGRRTVESVHRFRRDVIGSAVADWSAADRAAFASLLTRFVADFAGQTDDTAPDGG